MDLICFLLRFVVYALIAWIILGYVAAFGRLPWGHPIRKVYDAMSKVFEPVLAPIRRVVPPLRIGAVALDMSVIVVFLGIFILQSILCR
ncbi:MAG: YggT family protein [bacterium]|nr:YggT family protein [bacterium]